MLDLRRIRQNPDELDLALKNRNFKGPSADDVITLDKKRREVLAQTESLKATRNEESQKVAAIKRTGGDASAIMEDMKEVSTAIKALDEALASLDTQLEDTLLSIPNIPSQTVPVGPTDADNAVVRVFGEATKFDFPVKAHWDIGEDLGILDFGAAAKITGARFTVYKGLGARLERAVVNFFLDTHLENGYTEIFPPYMVNRSSMRATGQLPKFEDDAFKVANTDYFLIPTAEVPVTNLYRDEIISGDELPLRYCAYTACFRSEAGSAGRDTRGLIRQHQFNKVELVKFTRPEDSYNELEALTRDASHLLELLGLPYRVMCLSTGDMGFTSAKTYDLEVWMPSYGRYVEISSCSNFEDYQARRGNIRFRRAKGDKPELVHTLNGSGLAVGRTVAAILENYQQASGAVRVPDVLIPYLKCDTIGGKSNT